MGEEAENQSREGGGGELVGHLCHCGMLFHYITQERVYKVQLYAFMVMFDSISTCYGVRLTFLTS